jgi:cobalamin biosynthesis Mg chelatase CobN
MKKRVWSFRLGAGLSLLGAAIVLASLSGGATAQTNQVRVFVEAPTEQVKKGGPDFQVNIVADNVSNLAAFQLGLSYDPSVIKYVSVEGGSFLGSTGREAQCADPKVESGSPETLRFNCVTLGPPVSVQGAKAGANGSGVLATATFSPIGGGTTALDLKEGRLIAAELDSKGMPAEISTAVENSSLTVGSAGGGVSWMLLGPVIGVIAVVVAVGLVFFIVRLRARRPASVGMK